jgi:hypothetical protein
MAGTSSPAEKGLMSKLTASDQTNRVTEVCGHIVEQQPFGPGHDHLPFDIVSGRLEFDPLGDVVAGVAAELFAFGVGCGGQKTQGYCNAENGG